MKFDKRFYIIPTIFVFILLWYPFYNGDSSTTMVEMKEKIVSKVDTEDYRSLDDKELKKYFSISNEDTDGYLAYKAKDTMSAETLLILRVNDQEKLIELKEKVQKYITTERKKYDGYNMDQIRILDNYTMIDKKGYLYLSIVEDDSEWKQTFEHSL